MDERESPWNRSWRGVELLAFVEQRDVVIRDGRKVEKTIILDLAREDQLAPLIGGGAGARRELPYLATAQAVVSLPLPLPEEFDGFEEGTWHRVRLGNNEMHQAALYRDLDGVETDDPKLSVLDALDPVKAKLLTELVSIADAPEASASELATVVVSQSDSFVSVLHVGQGNCNAVCDGMGLPTMYFDLGAGCLQNSATRPASLEFCFTNGPQVVLSHWDFDHWYGGSISKAEAIACPLWLAPDQAIGVRTRKFAALLLSGNRLRRWPQGQTSHITSSTELVKCTGTTKNDSGIAMAVAVTGGKILCPADAAFDWMPVPSIVAGSPLNGLVATHHGSGHVGSPVPRPATGAALVFSFGSGNSFGHPTASRALYQGEGWTRQLDTPSGSVALGGPAILAPCGGMNCTIGTTQS